MSALRLEAEEAQSKVEELQSKVKTLEQESLSKEQEITSLNHKNQLLEARVETLESDNDTHKKRDGDSQGLVNQNESLQRKLQLLEEEAEEADKSLRETHEKYDKPLSIQFWPFLTLAPITDYAKPMSSQVITNVKSQLLRLPEISGRPSTRKWRRNTLKCTRTWRNFNGILRTSSFVQESG